MLAAELVTRDTAEAASAHLVRRTSLAIDKQRIADLADLDHDGAVAEILDHRGPDGGSAEPAPHGEDGADTVSWWVDRMCHPDSGLTDRLAWFWHGLLTTSGYKVSDNALMAEQLDHLRANGRGDYRTLLHGYVAGGALLDYLDASGSMAARPNENLARELMELFTIGRGNYGEDDVRAAARALAGWVVEDGRVEFRRENAFIAPLVLLGEQADWDTTLVVDRLCDHPATAVRVAGRLWTELVGVAPDPETAVDLGSWWQERDLAIEPLVERILDQDAFVAGRLSRPRTGLEWFCAARSALGLGTEPVGDGLWMLQRLGQLPYDPPNVGGWPRDDRLLSAGSLLARASVVQNIDLEMLPSGIERPGEILDACGLHQVSTSTANAIETLDGSAGGDEIDPDSLRLVRWRLALTSPEFNLS